MTTLLVRSSVTSRVRDNCVFSSLQDPGDWQTGDGVRPRECPQYRLADAGVVRGLGLTFLSQFAEL